MKEAIHYSVRNPNTSLLRDAGEWIKRHFGYNYLWTPSAYAVTIKPGFVYGYSGGDLPQNVLPLLLTVNSDFGLFGRSEPWDIKQVLEAGFLLERSTESLTLQNGGLRANVWIFNTQYHLRYLDEGLGNCVRSRVTDDLVTDDMESFREIGTHLINPRRVRGLNLAKKGFAERVDWINTIRKYLSPALSFQDIHQHLLVGVGERY